MKDLLMGFKLIRYGSKYKMFLTTAVIYFGIGILLEITSGGSGSMGFIYLQIVSGMLIASALSIESADFFLASPKMKKLQTSVPAFMYFVFFTIAFLIAVAIKLYYISKGLDVDVAARSILLGSIFGVITMVYYAVSYKLMLVATVIFIIVAIPLMITLMSSSLLDRLGLTFSLGFVPTTLISYVVILVGVCLYYLVACALYKKPFSKYAFRGIMSQQK